MAQVFTVNKFNEIKNIHSQCIEISLSSTNQRSYENIKLNFCIIKKTCICVNFYLHGQQ